MARVSEGQMGKLVKKHRVLLSSVKKCGTNATLNSSSIYFPVSGIYSRRQTAPWNISLLVLRKITDKGENNSMQLFFLVK